MTALELQRLKRRRVHNVVVSAYQNINSLAYDVALLLADVCFQRRKLWEERRLHLYLVKEERFEYAQRILLVRFVFKIS